MTARKTKDAGPKTEDITPLELAVYVLEDLPGPAWVTLTELARANLAGNLSYEAWRAASGAVIAHAARGLKDVVIVDLLG